VNDEAAASFATTFGRRHDAIEAYRCEDAEIVFVMIGSIASEAREAADRLRDAGEAVGLMRPRLLRPFPAVHCSACWPASGALPSSIRNFPYSQRTATDEHVGTLSS
jgi:pyruvate/2-oxoacid:ferredoxin oxidoreductase alpha subunit